MSMSLPTGAVPLSARHFRPRDRIPLSSLPATARLGRRLAAALAETLQQLAPAPWRTTLDGMEESSAPAGNAVHVLRFESSMGSIPARISLDAAGLSALTEVAMGGAGSEEPFAPGDRPPSAIERGILALALRSLTQAMAAAMAAEMTRPVSVFEADAEHSEDISEQEWMSFRFLLNVFGYSGELSFMLSKPEISAQLEAASGDDGEHDAQDSRRRSLQREVVKAGLVLSATLAEEQILLSDLMALQPGSFLRLRATAAAPVILACGGEAAFEGRLARSGEHLAVTVLRATG